MRPIVGLWESAERKIDPELHALAIRQVARITGKPQRQRLFTRRRTKENTLDFPGNQILYRSDHRLLLIAALSGLPASIVVNVLFDHLGINNADLARYEGMLVRFTSPLRRS